MSSGGLPLRSADDLRAAAAELAGVLAEHGVAEVTLAGRTLRSRDAVDLPGEIANEVARTGRASVTASGMEAEFRTDSLRWRTDAPGLAARLGSLARRES